MGIAERYRLLQEARRVHAPHAGETAGDAGEEAALAEILQARRGRTCALYPALRVPRPTGQGKFEIDLVIATPHRLVGIEVKHWGGAVEAGPNGAWRQFPTQGEAIDHRDPVELVGEKMRALAHYLQRQGVAFEPAALAARVVLTNPRLKLPNRLARLEEVLWLRQLRGELGPALWPDSAGFLATLFRNLGLLRGAPPAFPKFSALRAALDQLPTWDRLLLHGGQVLKGDLQRPKISLRAGRPLDRRAAQRIEVSMPRNLLLGWFQTPRVAWTDRAGGRHASPVTAEQQLAIKLAGRGVTREVPLAHVRSIEFGWIDESYYDDPKPPFSSYQRGAVYAGSITGVTDFGLFVNLDGHRDGLVHVSRLRGSRSQPSDYQEGETLRVRIRDTSIRGGKERIELELAE